MYDETQIKILELLDVLAVEVSAGRNETAELRGELRREAGELRCETGELRKEMRLGFDRVERRLGYLETRVEGVEDELRSFRGEFERHVAQLG